MIIAYNKINISQDLTLTFKDNTYTITHRRDLIPVMTEDFTNEELAIKKFEEMEKHYGCALTR